MAIHFEKSGYKTELKKIKTSKGMCINAETRPHKKYINNAIKRALLNRKSRSAEASVDSSIRRNLDIKNNAATQSNQIPVEFTQTQDAGLSFSGLPDEMLNEVCSFYLLKIGAL